MNISTFHTRFFTVASQVNPELSAERKLAAVGHLMNRRHKNRFMVFDLSEVSYPIDVLGDSVLSYSFPGSPSPPLGLLLKILVGLESWLRSDSQNVAVIHCITGKGRTRYALVKSGTIRLFALGCTAEPN